MGGRIAQYGRTDPRFADIQTDPRFRLPSKKNTRTKLDNRFAHILRDDDFSKKASVDRYGRKVEKGTGRKELERFYRVEDEDEDEDEEEDGDEDDAIQEELRRMERKYDPAREGGFSSSEDESSSDSDEKEEVEIDEEVELAQGIDVPMGEATARLAAVNLDWDNIRAVDLMAVASSFAPADGRVLKVTVYPSEFGRERLEREELEGPPKEIFAANKTADFDDEGTPEPSDSDSDAADEEIKKGLLKENKGEEFDPTALRTYQLDRLRYYYAILTCSSASVAKSLYDAMDGREYLSSANFFDLRFVPDDVTFEEKPRDECTAIPNAYRPNEFVTDALTHSKVKLTWDADDNTRKEVQKRAFSRKEVDENDLIAYIGSDSSDEEREEAESDNEPERSALRHSNSDGKKEKTDKAAALRAALGLSADRPTKSKKREPGAPVGDMQVTFSAGLSAAAPRGSVFENEPITDETTAEKYIRKEKERKARRKEKAKAARNAEGPDSAAIDAKASNGADERVDEGEKDPFDDPFFDDPATVSRDLAKAARRAEKAKKREERAKEETASAAQRAELELLMVDDNAVGGAGMRHFDMNEIVKAEKAKRRKGKKKGAKKGVGEEEIEKKIDGFKMDVQDPRFARLFESHEFAIDPTNPKFKGTEGMKALLEEGRRKRKAGRDDGEDEGMRRKSKKMKDNLESTAGDDLDKLVERVKGKAKARS
ncbi:hypothetical protein AOQ84DRAFT_375528 [Glonium stellatum]|uniref:NUC153 domain-containing protein n=1 Tax=Glonium stellatum TaxID=574774 RepID=A0A8E2JUL3_9PEZI|nr:hypothetical protein AOQ84DRAFT_375528 [Glonium stellatum]